MNHTLNFEGDWAFHGIMSDLATDYALSPFHRLGFDIDDAGIQALSEHYPSQVFRARHWSNHGKLTWVTLLLRLEEKVWLAAHGDGRNFAEIFAPDRESAVRWDQEIQKHIRREQKSATPDFYMMRVDCGDIEADAIDNIPEAVSDDFLRLCYGDDILPWVTAFGEKTLSRAGGLTIFDGPPGTGKTSLITQMIWRLQKTHVFYVLPAAQDNALSSPEMVPFWQKQNTRHADRVKVIVMEDSERLLWRRKGDNRESVSSLLNIADGLMGRMLRLHVICSVNARMEDLDPAILRPGRLTNHRCFRALQPAQARQLAELQKLPLPQEEAESYTLAEVLNPGSYERPRQKQSIGFNMATR